MSEQVAVSLSDDDHPGCCGQDHTITLTFDPPPGRWHKGEVPKVADILSMIACELLKGEHGTTTRIEISDRMVGF